MNHRYDLSRSTWPRERPVQPTKRPRRPANHRSLSCAAVTANTGPDGCHGLFWDESDVASPNDPASRLGAMPRPRDGVDAQFRPAAIVGAIGDSRRIAVGAAMAMDGTAHDAGRFLSERARSLRDGEESPFLQMMRLAAGIDSLINFGRGDPTFPRLRTIPSSPNEAESRSPAGIIGGTSSVARWPAGGTWPNRRNDRNGRRGRRRPTGGAVAAAHSDHGRGRQRSRAHVVLDHRRRKSRFRGDHD